MLETVETSLTSLFLHVFLNVLQRATESEAVPSMPFGSVAFNRGPLAIHYTVCTSGSSNALLINMSRRSQELALDTALPRVLGNTPAKCEVDRMNGCQENQRTDIQRLLRL